MAVTYPTTKYPALCTSEFEGSEEILGASSEAFGDTPTEELIAERGRVTVPSTISAPPSRELLGPMKQ
jgi:hypothetical protein